MSHRTKVAVGLVRRREQSQRQFSAPSARASARVALTGVLVYVVLDIALVWLRPQFSVLHNAESDYGSSGSWAWLMDLNFLLRCGLTLAAVRAITLALDDTEEPARPRTGIVLLLVWAAGSGLLAFFPDDPVGTRLRWTGKVHLVIAFIAFLAVLVGAILTSRRLRTNSVWRPSGRALVILSWMALVPLLLLGHAGFTAHSLGGLYEKVFLAMELLWLALAVGAVAVGRGPGLHVSGAASTPG